MTTPEHPLREALERVLHLSMEGDNVTIEEGMRRSKDRARLSRLVEAAIAWEESRERTGPQGVGVTYSNLMRAIRCEGENDDR